MMAIVTRHIGSATVRQMQAEGRAAQIVGLLIIIMALMFFVDWLKKLKSRGE